MKRWLWMGSSIFILSCFSVNGFTTSSFTQQNNNNNGFLGCGLVQQQQQQQRRQCNSLNMNLLDDMNNMITGSAFSQVVAQSSLPYETPFSSSVSLSEGTRTFAVQERLISFTGEDFDVKDVSDGSDFCNIRGAMMHLPGKDKMTIHTSQNNEEVLVLDRVLIAATPSYDIYRGGFNAQKIGWIEKKLVAMTDTFDVYMEGQGGFGVTGMFKPKPAYQISGDFMDRNFSMKNDKDEIVAKISDDGWFPDFDAMDHYQVQVASGMDALLVLACTCAIDEEFDEEHKAKKEKQKQD